jgi:hypothetical protein
MEMLFVRVVIAFCLAIFGLVMILNAGKSRTRANIGVGSYFLAAFIFGSLFFMR